MCREIFSFVDEMSEVDAGTGSGDTVSVLVGPRFARIERVFLCTNTVQALIQIPLAS